MKYKDYYAILGVSKSADDDEIKKAYRKLARKYHPDVSKDPQGEAKFKDIAEAYQTLKDKEKRAAYDNLGSYRPGQDFQPSQEWGSRFGDGGMSFDDIDLSDLFAQFGGGRGGRGGFGRGHSFATSGEDFDVAVEVSLEDAFRGSEVTLNLTMPERDAQGRVTRRDKQVKARIPKGVTDGQRLRLRGQGGRGHNGGHDGDLYLDIRLKPHAIYRPDGHDLYLDLALAPWEAALGAAVDVPTLGGTVTLKVAPGTSSGQKLRLGGRGLPKPGDKGAGDLYAVVQIVVPKTLSDKERALFTELAGVSTFDPRGTEKRHAA